MAIAGFLELYVFGPSDLKDFGSATLRCKIWSLPFLWLHPPPSTLAQSKERKGSNCAIWQLCLNLPSLHSFSKPTSLAFELRPNHFLVAHNLHREEAIIGPLQHACPAATEGAVVSVNLINFLENLQIRMLLGINFGKQMHLITVKSEHWTLLSPDLTQYRDEIYSLQMLLSRTQAGPGRTVKEKQEQNSPNHVQRLNLPSVDSMQRTLVLKQWLHESCRQPVPFWLTQPSLHILFYICLINFSFLVAHWDKNTHSHLSPPQTAPFTYKAVHPHFTSMFMRGGKSPARAERMAQDSMHIKPKRWGTVSPSLHPSRYHNAVVNGFHSDFCLGIPDGGVFFKVDKKTRTVVKSSCRWQAWSSLVFLPVAIACATGQVAGFRPSSSSGHCSLCRHCLTVMDTGTHCNGHT